MTSYEVDPTIYQQQLRAKMNKIKQLFSDINCPPLEVFDSPPLHYRMRAEFRVWHDGDDLYYIMFNSKTRERYRVDQFPQGSQLINQLMPLLIDKIKYNTVLRHKLFQVDFLTTLSGEALISLLYHRQLDDEWKSQAIQLKQWFVNKGFTLNLIGRAKKMKIAFDCDYVLEKLTVLDTVFTYKQVENCFTQPNASVAEKMLSWAVDCTKDSTGDLLELYCGNGNFSLALAQNFERVLASEQSKPSVKAALYNINANSITNVNVLRMSAEEITQAIQGKREFTRVKISGIDLTKYNISTVLVDPPRAGLDDATCAMVQQYDNIVYISCNPSTLKENLDTLLQTHRIVRHALFDQFPYTDHIETGVYLVRR
jgi:tRNA (uracil-5-)-methyltransferase